MSPLTRFLRILNVLVILSMLLAPLPLRAAQAAPQTAGASLAPLPGQPEAGGAPNDPLPGPDPRPVYSLEQLAAMQPAPLSAEEQAAEEAALLASFDLPEMGSAITPTLTLLGHGPLRPDEPAILAFQVDGAAGLEGLELRLEVPKYFAWLGEAGVFEANKRQLSLPVSAGRGLLRWQMDEKAQGPFEFQASLVYQGEEIAQASLSLEEDGLSLLPAQGGHAVGQGGRVEVHFPNGAAGEALAVRVRRPLAGRMPPTTLSSQPFEITARGLGEGGDGVRHFAQPLEIRVQYDEAQLRGDEHMLQVFYYDEQIRGWRALPTQVDTANNLLIAVSDHLTVFDINTGDWQEGRLPSLQPFQVSPFTGAASFSVPLWTPPGPAGLAPSLALSYNSQAVDNASANQTQGSWVGMGWSFDVGGSIERSMRGNADNLDDDSFAINAGGVASEVVKDPDGRYHTLDESFWKIEYNQYTYAWTAWDRQGTKYTFTPIASFPYQFFDDCKADPPFPYWYHSAPWKWGLTSVRNIYNQELRYTYTTEMKPVKHPCDEKSGLVTAATSIAAYPASIIYPGGQYSVTFDLGARTDYKLEWTDVSSKRFYENKYLQRVHVWNQGQEVRRYELGYANPSPIFPGHNWNAGGETLTLASVQEFGAGGSALPATTFTYDSLHLTEVNNGYGGRVAFDYEPEPWYEVNANPDRIDPDLRPPNTYDGMCIPRQTSIPPGEIYWIPRFAGISDGTASCMEPGYIGGLIVEGSAVMANTPGRFYQPGGAYRTAVTLYHAGDYHTPMTTTVGLHSGSDVLVTESTGGVTNTVTLDGYRALPGDASGVALYVYCERKCLVTSASLEWLAARYRVTQKRVYDGIDPTPQVFQYRYDEPATLDAQHAEPVELGYRSNSIYSEFRGHAAVQEIGPDGRLSQTFFYQDGYRQGRSSLSLASQADFLDNFSTGVISSTHWVGINYGVPVEERAVGDLALKLPGGTTNFTGVDRAVDAVTDGEYMLAQFMIRHNTAVKGGPPVGNPSGGIALVSGQSGSGDFHRFGLYAKSDITHTLTAHYTDNGVQFYETPLTTEQGPGMIWEPDTWYTVLIIIDGQGSQVWVWPRNDPGAMGRFSRAMPQTENHPWRMRLSAMDGSTWLDNYVEGRLYSLDETLYEAKVYPEVLKILGAWVYPTRETHLSFEGDGEWTGRRSSYLYGGLGNRTRSLEAGWNGAGWSDYRLSATSYLTSTTTTHYLVDYPWVESVYRCPAGSQNGACLNSTLEDNRLLQQSRNVYDNLIDTPPSQGKLTAQRSLLRWNGTGYGDPRYVDQIYGYDNWGNVQTTNAYNSEGTAGALASGNLRQSLTTYDPIYHTYLLWLTNPIGQTSSFTYDYNLGLPTSFTGPNGPDTTIQATYDAFGRPLKIIRPGDSGTSPTMQFAYSTYAAGDPFHIELTQKIDGGQNARFVRYYNGLGQVVQSQTVGAVLETGTYNVLSDTWYDAYGKAVRQSVPYTATNGVGFQALDLTKAATRTLYDTLGRTLVMTDTAGVTVSAVYRDLETRQTNGMGNTTRTLYDVWGRVTQVIPLNGDNDASPAGPAISYAYDDLNRLTMVWQGTQISTTLTYDFAGRKTAMNDPDMGTWTYGYDFLGNLTSQTDARNCITTLGYDSLNRLRQKTFSGTNCPNTTSILYSYDDTLNGNYGIGQRTGMVDASGSTAWRYNARGQLEQETRTITNGGTFVTHWGYNSAGLLTSMQYPSNNDSGLGEQVMYSYLPQMALNSMFVGTPPGDPIYVQGTSYDAAGRPTLRSVGSGDYPVQTRYTYYPWNALVQGGKLQQMTSTRDGQILQNLQYEHDRNSNVLSIQDYVQGDPQTQTFGYDNLDRLTSAEASGGTEGTYDPEDYNYDAATGNLSNKAGAAYSYEAQNANCPDGALDKAHAVVTAGANTYCYDSNGNMVRRVISNTTYILAYDAENHMTGYNGPNLNASFVYDGDGKRVQSTVNGATTTFVGNYLEWTGSTSSMVRYYYAGGVRVAMRTGASSLTWLVGDHLGSTSLAVNAGDGLSTTKGYKAWGEDRFGSVPTNYQYTGQYKERPAIGLYYYGARWYDSSLGRFSQADTVIPDPHNSLDYDRYQYVRSNPLKFTDPTGHFTESAIYDYIMGTCTLHTSQECEEWANGVYASWQADEEWWDMMRNAQAGDVLFGTRGKGTEACGVRKSQRNPNCQNFKLAFTGEGQTKLTGITTLHGNNPGASLQDIQSGNNYYDWIGFVRGGIFDHRAPRFYVRSGYIFRQTITSPLIVGGVTMVFTGLTTALGFMFPASNLGKVAGFFFGLGTGTMGSNWILDLADLEEGDVQVQIGPVTFNFQALPYNGGWQYEY